MIENIKDVIYIKKIVPSSSEYFRLELTNKENIIKYIGNRRYEQKPVVNIVKDELVEKFLDKLFRIIDSWKEEYIDNSMVDGTEWQLQITYTDGDKKYYRGKNGFPSNFESIDRIKYEIIEEIMEEDE